MKRMPALRISLNRSAAPVSSASALQTLNPATGLAQTIAVQASAAPRQKPRFCGRSLRAQLTVARSDRQVRGHESAEAFLK